VTAHRIAEPIQVVSTKNNVKIATTRANFKTSGNLVLPDTVQIAKGIKKFRDKISYLAYDNKGNPLEVSKVDGTHIVYIWGYQQQHPIAKIENATYSQVAARVVDLQNKSNADNDRTYGASGKEGILRTSLASLRSSLPKAMVTTFTYDPLIGVTSITDPSGDTSYYIYDAFNRLQYIKDTKGQVLKEYRYHYKEPELLATTTASNQAVTNGQQVQLTTTATGASGSLTYKWTVSNAHLNQVVTTTTGSLTINTTNNHAPNFTVACQVTDTQSNQVVTTHTQVNVTVNAAPLQVSPINYNASNYRVGTMVNYSINVSGGSGTYKYSWSKTNSQRTYTYTNNTRTLSNRILSTDCNTFIVKCTVKDLGTGAIVTKSVKVYPTGCLQGPRGGNQR
jgi:YD repeat-containing protein